MDTGLINQKIEIYSKTNGTNEYGGGADTFTLYWSTNAQVKALRSSRTLEANQSDLRMVSSFTCRARIDKVIRNSMMVKWRSQWYVIQNYTPDPVYKQFISFDGALQDNFSL